MAWRDLFGAFCSQYQIIPSKDTYVLGICNHCAKGTSLYTSIQTKVLESRGKSWANSKMSNELNTCQKLFEGHSLEVFATNTRSF